MAYAFLTMTLLYSTLHFSWLSTVVEKRYAVESDLYNHSILELKVTTRIHLMHSLHFFFFFSFYEGALVTSLDSIGNFVEMYVCVYACIYMCLCMQETSKPAENLYKSLSEPN